MKLKDLPGFGMNKKTDEFILPKQYKRIEKPHYRGNGIYNVNGLEALCRQFEEYCHQQAVIKQALIDEINKTSN